MQKCDVELILIKMDRSVHPLSLLFVGTALKDNGYKVKLNFPEPHDCEQKAQEIVASNPLFAGFSTLTGSILKYSSKISKKIKELNPNIPIIWGGIHASLQPQECLKEDFIDIVVIGEGEVTAVELANCLKNKESLHSVKGIAFKENGKIVVTEPRMPIKDLDTLNIDWNLINIKDSIYYDPQINEMILDFQSSRGCPFNCGFCYNLKFNARKWRSMSHEKVIEMIKNIKEKYNVTTFRFIDDYFSVDMKRAMKIMKDMAEIGTKSIYFQLRIESITEEFAENCIRYGIKRLFIGIESANERILKLVNKKTSNDLVLEKFEILKKYPIKVNAAFIIGFPTETLAEIRNTIRFGLKLNDILASANISYQNYIPFPGSDLYDLAIECGFKPPQILDDWEYLQSTLPIVGKIPWLPWATEETSKIFYLVDKYGKLLPREPSSSLIRTLGKIILSKFAKLRLKYFFFKFPWEIKVLFKFNRYYNPNSDKPYNPYADKPAT